MCYYLNVHFQGQSVNIILGLPFGVFVSDLLPKQISHNSSHIPQTPHFLDMLNLIITDHEEFLMTQIRRHKCRYTKQSLFINVLYGCYKFYGQ